MSSLAKTLVAVAVVAVALVGIYFAREILLPFLLAAVIAYTLDPLVAALERRGVRRSLGALVVMGGVGLAIGGVAAAAVPEMIDQFKSFYERLPAYRAALEEWLRPLAADIQERYAEQIQMLIEEAKSASSRIAPAAAGWAAAGLRGILGGIFGIVLSLLKILIIPVFAYYIMADKDQIAEALWGLLPSSAEQLVRDRALEIDRVLRAWVRGQLTVSLVLAVIYSLGLTIIGVPLGLLIGAVGGLANMVPYLGLIVGFLPAALLSLLHTGSWVGPAWVAGVFLAGQALEATVISPRLVGAGLGLPPAMILLAVLVGGELFGFAGLLLAVPTVAAGRVMLRSARDRSESTRVTHARRVSAPRPMRRRRPGA